jgi:viroplasmin and RNaseH domain-containing protein
MGKKKFYAVAMGRKPGIYLTWPDCQEQAQFAAVETMEKAIEYRNKYINEDYAQKFTISHIYQLPAATMTGAVELNQSTEQQILQPTLLPSSHTHGVHSDASKWQETSLFISQLDTLAS